MVDEGGERPGSREVASAKWITIQDINDKGLVSLLRADLDEGEAEAITLTHELKDWGSSSWGQLEYYMGKAGWKV